MPILVTRKTAVKKMTNTWAKESYVFQLWPIETNDLVSYLKKKKKTAPFFMDLLSEFL